MTDNEAKREKTFEEELPYVEERIKEVFNNHHNPNGCEDRLEICVLRDCKRTIRKAKEEINRQKTEIERLRKEANLVSILFQDLQERMNDIKAEAYKEFAERLKRSTVTVVLGNKIYAVATSKDVDNILKELVGEEE